jgi:hypothetical protein
MEWQSPFVSCSYGTPLRVESEVPSYGEIHVLLSLSESDI